MLTLNSSIDEQMDMLSKLKNEAEDKIVKAGFNPKVRAQELSVEDWLKMFGEFY